MASTARLLALTTILLLAGCDTYLAAREDIRAGGPAGSKRVLDAQQRLQEEQDRQEGLKQDKEIVEEERSVEESRLTEVNSELKVRTDRLAEAQRAGKITKAQEQERRRQYEQLVNDFQKVSLQLETRRATKDAKGAQEKQRQLGSLEQQIDALKKEIDILAP
jgi:chromosome segregation ATPase